MRKIKSFKLFESNEVDFTQLIKDALSDLTDDGFQLRISDEEVNDEISVYIHKPTTNTKGRPYTYNKHFEPSEIMDPLMELKSHMMSEGQVISNVYFHLVGYEAST